MAVLTVRPMGKFFPHADQALESFKNNQSFIVCGFHDRLNGKLVRKSWLKKNGYQNVRIRYNEGSESFIHAIENGKDLTISDHARKINARRI